MTSFVVRLQFWSSPYDRSSAAMAGFSQRQLAAFWSFQVLSTVLSAQNDAMEVMMHYYLQSSQFFSHLHVLLIVHFLLSRHTERRVPRLFWTSHPENEIGMCDGFWEGVVLGTWETTKRTSHAHRWWRKKWKSNFRMQQSMFSSFNKVQIRTRRVVECAFGRLKKRFSVVHECHLNDPIFASEIGLLCCSLHNVIERKEKRRRTCFPNCATPLIATLSSPAIAVREALAAYCFTL